MSFFGAISSVWQRFCALFKAKDQKSKAAETPTEPFIQYLPPEITLEILQYAGVPAAFCLALTSRGYYAALRPILPRKIRWSDLYPLLKVLEKTSTEFQICYNCMALRRWNPEWKLGDPRKTPSTACLFPRIIPNIGSLDFMSLAFPDSVGFCEARLIMTAYRKGVEYGLPLERLNWVDRNEAGRQCFHRLRPGIYEHRQSKARIILGRLCTRSVLDIMVMGYGNYFREMWLHYDGRPICPHTTIWQSTISLNTIHSFATMDERQQTLLKRIPIFDKTLACRKCRTDYTINLYMPRAGCLRVKFVVYEDLGPSQFPSEEEWVSRNTVLPYRLERHRDLGKVRRLWKQCDILQMIGLGPTE